MADVDTTGLVVGMAYGTDMMGVIVTIVEYPPAHCPHATVTVLVVQTVSVTVLETPLALIMEAEVGPNVSGNPSKTLDVDNEVLWLLILIVFVVQYVTVKVDVLLTLLAPGPAIVVGLGAWLVTVPGVMVFMPEIGRMVDPPGHFEHARVMYLVVQYVLVDV